MADERGATATAPAPTAATPAIPGSEPLPAVPAGTTMQSLLTPNANDNDPKYAHFGTLAVERSHLGEFQQAQNYLAKDPEAVSAMYAMTHAKDAHTVEFITDGNDRYDHSTRTLYWDPKSALLNTNGTSQTPALGLLHEESHLIEHQQNPQQYFAGIRDTTPRAYNNREEQRVIEGIENRAATILGEGIRHDHGGRPFNAKDPISVTPESPPRSQNDLPQKIDGQLMAARALGAETPPNVSSPSAVQPWDGKAHTGSVVHVDENTAAQHVGRGNYQVYDVQRDLGGTMPPQGVRDVSIDRQGNVGIPHSPGLANER